MYAGYASSGDINEIASVVTLFIEDKNLTSLETKEDLWLELVNNGIQTW